MSDVLLVAGVAMAAGLAVTSVLLLLYCLRARGRRETPEATNLYEESRQVPFAEPNRYEQLVIESAFSSPEQTSGNSVCETRSSPMSSDHDRSRKDLANISDEDEVRSSGVYENVPRNLPGARNTRQGRRLVRLPAVSSLEDDTPVQTDGEEDGNSPAPPERCKPEERPCGERREVTRTGNDGEEVPSRDTPSIDQSQGVQAAPPVPSRRGRTLQRQDACDESQEGILDASTENGVAGHGGEEREGARADGQGSDPRTPPSRQRGRRNGVKNSLGDATAAERFLYLQREASASSDHEEVVVTPDGVKVCASPFPFRDVPLEFSHSKTLPMTLGSPGDASTHNGRSLTALKSRSLQKGEGSTVSHDDVIVTSDGLRVVTSSPPVPTRHVTGSSAASTSEDRCDVETVPDVPPPPPRREGVKILTLRR